MSLNNAWEASWVKDNTCKYGCFSLIMIVLYRQTFLYQFVCMHAFVYVLRDLSEHETRLKTRTSCETTLSVDQSVVTLKARDSLVFVSLYCF